MTLSYTVLSELFQKKLLAEEELKGIKGEKVHLRDRVVIIQCTKAPEVVAKTVNVLNKFGNTKEADRLIG